MIPRRIARHAGAFTITEAVVVTAVTATVIALVLPAVSSVRENAKTMQGLANLTEIGQTLHLYSVDNAGMLPNGYWTGKVWPTVGTGPGETDWMILLNDYLAGTGDSYTSLFNGPAAGVMLPLFRDPNAAIPDQGQHHYICHPMLMPDRDHVAAADYVRANITSGSINQVFKDAYKDIYQYRLNRFRRPGEVVLAMDGIQVTSTNTNIFPWTSFATAFNMDGGSVTPPNLNAAPPPASFPAGMYYDSTQTDMNTPILPGLNTDGPAAGRADIRWRQKNNTAANFLFPDGHVETRTQNSVTKRNIRVDK